MLSHMSPIWILKKLTLHQKFGNCCPIFNKMSIMFGIEVLILFFFENTHKS